MKKTLLYTLGFLTLGSIIAIVPVAAEGEPAGDTQPVPEESLVVVEDRDLEENLGVEDLNGEDIPGLKLNAYVQETYDGQILVDGTSDMGIDGEEVLPEANALDLDCSAATLCGWHKFEDDAGNKVYLCYGWCPNDLSCKVKVKKLPPAVPDDAPALADPGGDFLLAGWWELKCDCY